MTISNQVSLFQGAGYRLDSLAAISPSGAASFSDAANVSAVSVNTIQSYQEVRVDNLQRQMVPPLLAHMTFSQVFAIQLAENALNDPNRYVGAAVWNHAACVAKYGAISNINRSIVLGDRIAANV